MNNTIDYKTNKADVISASIEAMDWHIQQTNRLKQQQKVLLGLTGLLLITHFL